MKIKEAKKILEDLVKEYKEENDFVGKELIDAIEILLNELQLKDKVINLIAGNLTTDYHDISWVEEYYYKMAKEIDTKKQL